MERLTTNDPKTNTEAALNLFFVKNGEAWIRGYGDNGADISLNDFARKVFRANEIDADLSSAESVSETMYDNLFLDDLTMPETLLALLYTAGWAFAELRGCLAAYEDTGLTPEEIKNSITDANDMVKIAFALRELRKYKQAEAEGRLLVLPCKVGDTVYFPTLDRHNDAVIVGIRIISGNCFFEWENYDESPDLVELWEQDVFEISDIGKTVFLTREEAEAALKERSE